MNNDSNSTLWAVICNIAGLLGQFVLVIGNVIIPLVIWLVLRKKNSLVDAHGKSVLNFQISLWIYGIIAVIFILLGIGATGATTVLQFSMTSAITIFIFMILAIIAIVFLIVLFFIEVVCTIIACIKASNGESYRYPWSIRFL